MSPLHLLISQHIQSFIKLNRHVKCHRGPHAICIIVCAVHLISLSQCPSPSRSLSVLSHWGWSVTYIINPPGMAGTRATLSTMPLFSRSPSLVSPLSTKLMWPNFLLTVQCSPLEQDKPTNIHVKVALINVSLWIQWPCVMWKGSRIFVSFSSLLLFFLAHNLTVLTKSHSSPCVMN